MLKEEYISFIRPQLEEIGVDFNAFLMAMESQPAVSIKLNRKKCDNIEEIGYGEKLERVAWCESGYYLPERPQFTLNPLLHAGAFYVQDASSMVYESITKRIVETLLPSPTGTSDSRLSVLDMCAAPGGKSTSMLNALQENTLLVANEFVGQRANILRENLLKWGHAEMIITNSPTDRFARVGERFHIVAVDAPCSGEGMMRKDDEACRQWNEGLVAQCAALQREILSNAIDALLPGGYLIYSTCTFNTIENEGNLQWLIEQGLELAEAPQRFMPHITRGEGLFVVTLRKPGELPAAINPEKTKELIRKNCKVIQDGTPMKEIKESRKGKIELPIGESVLSNSYHRGEYPEVELSESEALNYLRGEALTLPAETPRGYAVMTYKGHPLGLMKNIGNRANNLYPQHWRIKHL